MGTEPPTPRRPSAPRAPHRSIRRVLLILLDTRGRWWLSPRVWILLLIAGNFCTTAWISDRRHYFSASGGGSVTVYWDGSTATLDRPQGSRGGALWRVETDLEYRGTVRRLWANASLSVTGLGSLAADPSPTQMEQIKQLAADRAAEYALSERTSDRVDSPGARQWLGQTWAQQILSGSTATMERPLNLADRVAVAFAPTVRILSLVVFALVVLCWFLRGAQIAAYRRMLRRHEAGRCPRCDYDISAAPDRVCSECGCDHRAIRQEAIDALRRAKRWPLEEPVPGGPA